MFSTRSEHSRQGVFVVKDSVNMSLSKFLEVANDREAWFAIVIGVAESTGRLNSNKITERIPHQALRLYCRPHASLSRVRLFGTPWSGVRGSPFPSPGIFPTQGSNLHLCVSCIADVFFTTEIPGEPRPDT